MHIKLKKQINRYFNYFVRTLNNSGRKIKQIIFNTNDSLKLDYLSWFLNRHENYINDFVKISNENYIRNESDPKIISFYLPQFYENETNNKYFGKGFMEWYNVTKAIPQFTGHYQPQLPIDVGFYNLSHDDIMYRQIELAKKYGIYGFCFYYYWFSGETLLEKPILNFLNNKELNFPFCLMWTNETWTSIWGDGNHRNIIKKQELLTGDDDKFVKDILKYIQDERYIKVKDKPLLIIYQSKFFDEDEFNTFLNNIKAKIKELAGVDIYILTTNSGIKEQINEQIEGVIEFSHQNLPIQKYQSNMTGKYINSNFTGKVVDIKRAMSNKLHIINNKYKTFKCLYPGWDNTPRKAYALNGCYVFDMGPKEYKQWLSDLIKWTKNQHLKEEQFIYVNAWNEWAEGAHLEPDQHYGYAYLQATKEALEESRENN